MFAAEGAPASAREIGEKGSNLLGFEAAEVGFPVPGFETAEQANSDQTSLPGSSAWPPWRDRSHGEMAKRKILEIISDNGMATSISAEVM